MENNLGRGNLLFLHKYVSFKNENQPAVIAAGFTVWWKINCTVSIVLFLHSDNCNPVS